MADQELIRALRTESLYKDKATLEIMDLCMEAADRMTAVLGDLERVTRERDAAVEDLRKLVPAWQWRGPKGAEM